MLLCGMSELDITPPLGSSIPGYTEERKSVGIRDPLYAKAWVVESDETVLAFIAVDALYIPAREANRIRERLLTYTGIPVERTMVSATHTHTGPPVRIGLDGSLSEEYLAYMADRAADAAIVAYNGRKPARIGWGTGQVGDVSFNRRYWMKNGQLRTNPGRLNPDIDRPAGPIDPELSVVRVDSLDGQPMGILTSFACHTDTTGGSVYSGDYPAILSAAVKKSLGEHVVSLFLLGACGDINHTDPGKPMPAERNFPQIIGQRLAGEALRVRECIETSTDAEAGAVRAFIPMKLREASQREIEHARSVLRDNRAVGAERFFAEQVLKVAELPGGEALLEVQAIHLGDLAFVGLPGELFMELGLAVKMASPYASTIVNTLCSGSIYGYVCTEAAYEQGGYEPRLKVFNRIAPGTGERLTQCASALLEQLARAE
ncbi:neutral/alkaline non-lysosomal ceramidase N-terminal domain-containing protein [Paenibacillus oceani]|uniref:Neutral/alkaline non-lysosomal ceramidase N-terminal domain-containing protein n=1 Tax=Paenibacillus oceani TaxID=2772510 RepID=A0A927GZ95_9BACL|nr:neutral/alkaline non-lysosomal ceramidase N-terminal domain-containing protein [Paenibacillus oceani]MBD2861857.1 neutral/alkaline non-lysosomal ceramidase N-terminal domain-containing protein [Paenibacillus oceani]